MLGSTGRKVTPLAPVIDNVNGSLSFGAISTNGGTAGPSKPGVLAVVKFRGKALTGVSNLTLSDVILTNILGFEQPVSVNLEQCRGEALCDQAVAGEHAGVHHRSDLHHRCGRRVRP